MILALETIGCELCGYKDFKEVYPSNIFDPEFAPERFFSSSRTEAGYLRIVQCRNCGLTQTNPRDDDVTLAWIYDHLADKSYHAEDQNRKVTAKAHLDIVEQYCPERGSLLDIGCATGVFTGVAQVAGWQAVGCDASEWAIEQAKSAYPDVVFMHSMLEELDIAANSYDVIVLWDVLEHVRSPHETLRLIRSWLKPTGFLFLNLPNIDSLAAKLMGRWWVLLLREHLWYFSPETIGRLLTQCDYDLVETHPNFVTFSLGNIGDRLAQYNSLVTGPAQWVAKAEWARRITLRFPMGEMLVVARPR